jgi:lipoyl(octanoyl) transferase
MSAPPISKQSDVSQLGVRQIQVRHLGMTAYQDILLAMQEYTQARDSQSPDMLWVTEHPPVYTLGLNRRDVRLPHNDIPVVMVDRGGKITYHGPGQLIIYCLIDLARLHLNVRQWVTILEQSMVEWLASHGVQAQARADAPGVYVNGDKIASLGLRLKNQCCYHGLSLNVDMDLSPFLAIDPCGYQGMRMTQTKTLGIQQSLTQIADALTQRIQEKLTHV